MEATELRIGNYIEFCASDSWSLHTVVPKDLHVMHVFDNDPSESYRPIPLTDEWLEKFGFKNWGDKYTFGLKTVNIHSRKRGFVLRKSFPIIKYVHQLQNLYFALTGEELTLQQ